MKNVNNRMASSVPGDMSKRNRLILKTAKAILTQQVGNGITKTRPEARITASTSGGLRIQLGELRGFGPVYGKTMDQLGWTVEAFGPDTLTVYMSDAVILRRTLEAAQ